MFISVDFTRLKQHQEYLFEELRLLRQIEESLHQLLRLNSNDASLNTDFYLQQLQFVSSRIQNTMLRKELLENTYLILMDAKNNVSSRIKNIANSINQQQ